MTIDGQTEMNTHTDQQAQSKRNGDDPDQFFIEFHTR
jgi:hypothetical protein